MLVVNAAATNIVRFIKLLRAVTCATWLFDSFASDWVIACLAVCWVHLIRRDRWGKQIDLWSAACGLLFINLEY